MNNQYVEHKLLFWILIFAQKKTGLIFRLLLFIFYGRQLRQGNSSFQYLASLPLALFLCPSARKVHSITHLYLSSFSTRVLLLMGWESISRNRSRPQESAIPIANGRRRTKATATLKSKAASALNRGQVGINGAEGGILASFCNWPIKQRDT